MNKEQIFDEVYKNFEKDCISGTGKKMSKEEFINFIKTQPVFSENWGLKIEERELSLEERAEYKKKRDGISRTFVSYTHQMLDNSNIPTKLITITYKEQTIESYE